MVLDMVLDTVLGMILDMVFKSSGIALMILLRLGIWCSSHPKHNVSVVGYTHNICRLQTVSKKLQQPPLKQSQ